MCVRVCARVLSLRKKIGSEIKIRIKLRNADIRFKEAIFTSILFPHMRTAQSSDIVSRGQCRRYWKPSLVLNMNGESLSSGWLARASGVFPPCRGRFLLEHYNHHAQQIDLQLTSIRGHAFTNDLCFSFFCAEKRMRISKDLLIPI